MNPPFEPLALTLSLGFILAIGLTPQFTEFMKAGIPNIHMRTLTFILIFMASTYLLIGIVKSLSYEEETQK